MDIDIVIYSIEIQKKLPTGRKYYEWGGFLLVILQVVIPKTNNRFYDR